MNDKIEFIYKALFAAQGEFPVINKGKTATVVMKSGGKYSYKYADLPDIKDAVDPILRKHGLTTTHSVIFKEGHEFLVTKLIHVESLEFIQSLTLIPQGLSQQERGACLTYARRYTLCGILDIAADEDVDGIPKQNASSVKVENNNTTTPKDKPKTNSNSYVVNFGKYKGKTLDDLGEKAVDSYLHQLHFAAERDGKSVHKSVLDLEAAARLRWNWPNKVDMNEVLPF